MKCAFCGKELTEGAEFCPECGMILSLGGVTNEPDESNTDEVEVPGYTPNVFRAMDFEPEENVPAMELEVTDEEETAEVVEIIPEYTEITESEEAEADGIDEAAEVGEPEEIAGEEEFTAPEYDPNAQVSEEFLQQAAAVTENEESAEEAAEEAVAEAVPEVIIEEPAEVTEEFAPPEYDGELTGAAEAYEADEAQQEAESVDAYPAYDDGAAVIVPQEEPTEDESLFASLFENEDAEKIEDITPVKEKAEKKSKNSFVAVAAIILVLVLVVLGGGYVFKTVLPKIVDTGATTTASTEEKADSTTEKTTAEKTSDKKETTTKPTTTEPTTAKPTTTKPTTTKPTTTKPTTTKATTTKPTQAADEGAEATVVEPSEYNLDYVAFFPKDGDISIKSAPSASAANMVTHPYGYPVFAYAKEGSYYYVHSAYHDFIGWVNAENIEKYGEQEENTEAQQPEQEATESAGAQQSVSYLAMINSAEGLNFRTGPGYDYGADFVIPGGFYVRVTAESEENPGWVYVTVEDDRYPYGAPSGWVLEDYLV